jgi:hypothetical protein
MRAGCAGWLQARGLVAGAGGAMLLTVVLCVLGFLLYNCIGFMTTNKPPGRRHTMILGILNMLLCLFMFLHYTYI